MNRFTHPIFPFQCSIPKGWDIMPSPWAKTITRSSSATSEKLSHVLDRADHPFVCLYRTPNDSRQSTSLFQGVAKPDLVLQYLGGATGILDLSLEEMGQAFLDFKILTRFDSYVMGGGRGAYAKISLTVTNNNGEQHPAISEVIVLHVAPFCYIFGLSGSSNLQIRPEEDFKNIIQSIRFR